MSDRSEKWSMPVEGLIGFAHCGFFDTWYPWSGLSYEGRLARLISDLKEAGANSFRPQVHWHQVEPLMIEGIMGPEDVTGELVEAYAKGELPVRWDKYDLMVDALVNAGIEPHLVVAAGYDFQIPNAETRRGYARGIPDVVGRDRYLGQAFLHARSVVRRYRGKVHMWQLENELDGAGETLLFARWRSGRSWLDWGFLTALLEVISKAVEEEDPTALRSHNFQKDARLFCWKKDIEAWRKYLDIIGVDAFPNYIFGFPQMGRLVGRSVEKALIVSDGRPVVVLESGYPTRPAHRGYSEGRQAEFVREAISATFEAGGSGYYYYEVCSPEGFPVQGPWSDRFFQSIEPWWGFVRKDDTKKPAFFEFKRLAEKVCRGEFGRRHARS